MPFQLQNEIKNNDYIPHDMSQKKYDSLIIQALKHDYIGVKSEYVSKQLTKLLGKVCEIEGDEECLLICPCCGYRTLKSRGEYEICPICNWEDDGNNEFSLDVYSLPNHMTLKEAREIFGLAFNKKSKETRLNDIIERYNKSCK